MSDRPPTNGSIAFCQQKLVRPVIVLPKSCLASPHLIVKKGVSIKMISSSLTKTNLSKNTRDAPMLYFLNFT